MAEPENGTEVETLVTAGGVLFSLEVVLPARRVLKGAEVLRYDEVADTAEDVNDAESVIVAEEEIPV